MSVIRIQKGRDINLKGKAAKQIDAATVPSEVAVQPPDFCGMRPRLLLKEGDTVKVGTPVLEDKNNSDVVVVSPASGKVVSVNRGEKRALLEVVIKTDGKQEAFKQNKFSAEEIKKLSREKIINHLLAGGVWPCIRQRPFSKIAHPEDTPKSIFIQAMNTEPLALDVDFILNDREKDFYAGLGILGKLTKGGVHICCDSSAQSKALTSIPPTKETVHAEIHRFSGPHPAGNVSTHIYNIDPIKRGDIVWYLRTEDVLRVADLFLKGVFSPERFVAVTGAGASKRVYKKTVIGASIKDLLEGSSASGKRCISGSVLRGTDVGAKGFLCFYDSQITIIPEGGKREFLGWINPGFNSYSFSKTFMSSIKGDSQEVSLDTDRHGSDRAIVFNHIYDDYVALDIMTNFLLKAVIAGEIEEAEKLGILECDEEDFALCAFACPSKIDVGGIIRQGLDLIEKEG